MRYRDGPTRRAGSSQLFVPKPVSISTRPLAVSTSSTWHPVSPHPSGYSVPQLRWWTFTCAVCWTAALRARVDRHLCLLVPALQFGGGQVERPCEREAGEKAGDEVQPRMSNAASPAVDDREERQEDHIADDVVGDLRTGRGIRVSHRDELRPVALAPERVLRVFVHEADVEVPADGQRRD